MPHSQHVHDGERGRFAAHGLPRTVRSSKVHVEGVPLGLLPDREYDEVVFQAQTGDLVVLFSDGVSDHLSATGEEYGRGRLAQVVRRCCGCDAEGNRRQRFSPISTGSTPSDSTIRR